MNRTCVRFTPEYALLYTNRTNRTVQGHMSGVADSLDYYIKRLINTRFPIDLFDKSCIIRDVQGFGSDALPEKAKSIP